MMTMFNRVMIGLLSSPLHVLVGGDMLLLSYTGRASGRRYQVPLTAVRDGADLLAVSYRRRTWWRNLRGGAAVRLRLRGQELAATGTAFEDAADVAALLVVYLRHRPGYARHFGVQRDARGVPIDADVWEAARPRVMVRFTPAE
jgi:deazaflavin-dependent oxidoreductase (nitroreductase family)